MVIGYPNHRLDRAIHPEMYTWLEGKNEDKYPLAVEQYRYKGAEVERIIKTPFGSLERKEVYVRKLLSRFHDNPRLVSSHKLLSSYAKEPASPKNWLGLLI